MSYSNHNLRTDLQEWKNRLYRAPYAQFGNQLKYFLDNLNSIPQLKGLIQESTLKHTFSKDEYEEWSNGANYGRSTDIVYQSLENQAAVSFQLLNYVVEGSKSYDLHNLIIFQSSGFDKTKNSIIEDYISPIIYFLHEKLDKSNSTIYLLEKYKRRTEWFTKKELFDKYKSAQKGYEQILEDDLRLFLFDQGIDYPFSTPSSASGRADLIGEIETDNPIVIEIKIFDREKGYGKDRIKDGFNQVVQYTNDYNKDVGYLVIFNMDSAELNFNFSGDSRTFPPSVHFNNKTFYFVVINSSISMTASKRGTLQEIEITESELKKN